MTNCDGCKSEKIVTEVNREKGQCIDCLAEEVIIVLERDDLLANRLAELIWTKIAEKIAKDYQPKKD